MSKKSKHASSVQQSANAQSGVMDRPHPGETASQEAMIAELKEELAARAKEQTALNVLNHQALLGLSLPRFFSSLVDQVVQALKVDACRLLVSAYGTDWVVQAACGWPDALPEATLLPEQGSLAWLASHGSQVVVMQDRTTESRCQLGSDYQHMQSAAAIAIPRANFCWGVLEAGSFQQRVFRPDALDFLKSLVSLLSDLLQANDRLLESRETDERMRLAMSLSRDGVFDWHISNNQVYWDLRLYEMLGLLKKQAFLPVENVLNLLHPDDRTLFSEFIASCLEQSHPCEREFRVRHSNGNYRILRLRGSVLIDSQGQPFRLVGLITDVSEIRAALLREQESESRFMALADAMPVLMCICDETGQAVYYNRACQEFAGVSSEELLDKTWIHWVHPDDRQKLIEIYTAAIPQRALFTFEYRGIRHDGLLRYLMNTGAPRFQPDGRFVGYIIGAMDVTEERKASARIQRIMDANLAGILYIRLDGQILDCNDAFLEMTGYSREELKQGVDLWTLTPQEYVPLCTTAIQQLKETDACDPFEKQYLRKDGSLLDVLVTATRLVEENTDIALIIVFDISSRKQAQRALEKQLDRELLSRKILEIASRSDCVESVMDEAVRIIGRQFQADRTMVVYYPPQNTGLKISSQYLSSEAIMPFNFSDFPPDLEESLQKYVPAYLKRVKGPVTSSEAFFNIIERVFRFNNLPEEIIALHMQSYRQLWLERYCVRSYVRLDIQYLGKYYGSLNLQHCSQTDMWNAADLDLLGDAVNYLGTAFYQMELAQHEQQVMRQLEKSYNLIHIISQAQNHFITSGDNWEMFRELLNRLLTYTESEYGFIGQVLHDADGNPYLKTNFLTDISWNEATHKLYDDNVAAGLEFHNLKTLFGEVMVTGQPVFANDPAHDPRRGGLPEGHPALNAFLGLPLYKGDDLVGMIGLANRPGGYDKALADDLHPYLVACANIIVGVRNEALRERLTQELKLSEQNLKKYAGRLEQSNLELEQFATIASHDLQAPLRKVMVFSSFLRTSLGDALNEECLDYMDRIQKATEKMQSLITDLLALSRVSRKGNPFTPVDLMAITQEVLSDLSDSIQETGAQVLIGDMMSIDADGLQMQQVLQNLLGNALKFHKPGIPPRIEISAFPLSDALCQIRIRDNGIGFDEKYLDRIFTIFERLHGEQEYSGTGMGLAIVKKIVARHQGDVTARSKPGEGATFIITLPIHPAEASPLKGLT
jgi:PAS domain S-box-containing protein